MPAQVACLLKHKSRRYGIDGRHQHSGSWSPVDVRSAEDHGPDSVLLASEVVDGVTHRFGGVLHLVLEGTSRIHK